MDWKKGGAISLSLISFFGSLVSLAGLLYGYAHAEWFNEIGFGFLVWILLIALLSGIIAVILVITSHMPDMEIYMFLSIFGIVLSIFVAIPIDISYGLAHTEIG